MATSASDDTEILEEQIEEASMEHAIDRDPGKSLWRSIIALVVIGILLGAIIFAIPGLDGVADALKRANTGWIVAAFVLEIASCLGYVLVFQFVFRRAPMRFAARLALAELAFGAAVSLGGAGGIALGAWVLRTRGVPMGKIAERSAVLFLLTSAVNLVVLIVAALGVAVGVFDAPANPLLGWLPLAAGLLILAFFVGLPRWARSGAARRGQDTKLGRTLVGTADSIVTTRRLLVQPSWGLLGAYLYLLCDIAVLWSCFQALGVSVPFAALILAYQIGYLANIIPIPGGLIALDAGLVGMLVLYGASATTATAAVLVYHAIALWIPVLWGTISFLLLRRSLDEPLVPRPLPR
jgi:uncharacterized protein (TIRG00374 family)